MYGYDPGHPENSCDIAFIESMTRNGKSRSQASLEVANIGWHALRAKDLDRAIKRFNQAWLLDRQSALALWGFGVWEALNGNYVRAEEFLRQAVAIRQGDPGLYVDLGRTVMINATQANDAAKLAEARALFASAKGIDPNFAPAYIQEAALDLHEERYADAWEQVMRAEKLDPKSVDAELIAELEKKMPRPVR